MHLKTFYKDNPNIGTYKMAYGLMPSQAGASSNAKQMYIIHHFTYF